MKQRLGKTLAAYGAAIPAVLTSQEAAADDETGAAVRIEQAQYDRAVLDFESEIRRRRDAMHAEHLENTRAIFGQEAAE